MRVKYEGKKWEVGKGGWEEGISGGEGGGEKVLSVEDGE